MQNQKGAESSFIWEFRLCRRWLAQEKQFQKALVTFQPNNNSISSP